MRPGGTVASLIRRYEVQNEKKLTTEQCSTSPHKINNMKVTITSPRSVISKTSSCGSSSISNQSSSYDYEKSLMEQHPTSPCKISDTSVMISSPRSVISKSAECVSSDSSVIVSSPISDQVDHQEKNLMERHTASSHKLDNATITSPRSVISKSFSCVNSGSPDIDSSSMIDQFSSEHHEHRTTSTNKVGNTEVMIASPRSVIRKSSSYVSSDSSDVETSFPSDQVSSDPHPSQEDIWVSSLDLNEEDSELIEEEQDFDIFGATFPSPSFNARTEREGFCEEELNKLILNSDMEEPIFWPFENESYNTPDLDEFLSVSPCRHTLDMNVSVKSGLGPIRVRTHHSNEFKVISGPERKTVPNPEPNLTSTTTRAPEILNMPSRLGRLSTAPHVVKDENMFPTKGATERNFNKSLRSLIQGGLRTFKENSIEKSIGLHEFDGHEGIGGFGADIDSPLCGSPWQISSMMKFGAQRIKRGPVKHML